MDCARQKAQGMVRNGPGLLQGMVICGRCGHHMQTVYKHTPRYTCRGLLRTADVPSECTSVRSPVVDAVIVQAFLAAIQPAQLDALDEILAAQQSERQRLDRQWQEQRQRAEYEVQLAQRQYDAVDPTNRLVAGELERRWEEKLGQRQHMEEEYQRYQQTPHPETVPTPLRELFRHVSQRLPELWPALTNPQKKELLRSLISQVIVKRPVPDQIALRIVWISGCYTDCTTQTLIHREQDVTDYAKMVERIQQLWQQGYKDEQMAAQLSAEGFHSARSPHVTPQSVMKIRLAHQWYLHTWQMRGVEEVDGYLTARGVAKLLDIDSSTILRFVYAQVIPPDYVTHHPTSDTYLIRNDAQLMAQLRARILHNKQRNGMVKPTTAESA